MDEDKDYLAKYEVKEDKVNEALQHREKIKGLETKGEELSGKITDNEKELKNLQDKGIDTPEAEERFKELRQEHDSLHGQQNENNSDLSTARQDYEKFKEDNSGLSQEADSMTVESDYKGDTGRDLDQNVGGYDTFQQEDTSKPLDEQSKAQAREAVAGTSLDQEGNEQENNTPEQEPMQEEQETESPEVEIESYDEKLDPEQQQMMEEKKQELESGQNDQTVEEVHQEIQQKLDEHAEQRQMEQGGEQEQEGLEAEEGPLSDYPAEEGERETVAVVREKGQEQEQDDQER